jgi:heat shock protein HslJ
VQKILLVLTIFCLAACQPSAETGVTEEPAASSPNFEAVENQEEPRDESRDEPLDKPWDEPEEIPIAGEWNLVAIDQQPLKSGGTPTLVFEQDGSCWGSTGVNKFQSRVDLKKLAEGWLKLGPAAVTRMAGPPEAMALEKLFLTRLESVSSFEVEGDTLHLYTGDSETVTFQRIHR